MASDENSLTSLSFYQAQLLASDLEATENEMKEVYIYVVCLTFDYYCIRSHHCSIYRPVTRFSSTTNLRWPSKLALARLVVQDKIIVVAFLPKTVILMPF